MERPKRKDIDWSAAKYDDCMCGKHAAIMEGMCPECHDDAYNLQIENMYLDRIYEIEKSKSSMREKLENIDLDYILDFDIENIGNVYVMDRSIFHHLRRFHDDTGARFIEYTPEGARLFGLKIVFVQHECLMKGVL